MTEELKEKIREILEKKEVCMGSYFIPKREPLVRSPITRQPAPVQFQQPMAPMPIVSNSHTLTQEFEEKTKKPELSVDQKATLIADMPHLAAEMINQNLARSISDVNKITKSKW